MGFTLNQTCCYDIIPLKQGGFMRTPKRDYWTERGFSSRDEWLESKTKKYREKTIKYCPHCDEACFGNRNYCSNKCNILANIKISKTDCWEWQKCITPSGYAAVKDLDERTQKKGNSQKNILVHRLSYMIFKGEIPKNKFVCHSCDNRVCCNPNHLWLGSHKDNSRDALKKGRLNLSGLTYRLTKGGKSPSSKLEPYISEIRKRISNNERIVEIAESYNVSPQAIYSIKHGKTWKEDYGGL